MSGDDDAPGWDAITAQFERLYPGQEPEHWGTSIPERVVFGGPQALDGISAYRADEPKPHWHWVTYGLTELYTKDSDDPAWSGWGYELTMRVPLDGDEPPLWALTTLQNLANFAHAKRWVVEAGHKFDAGRPIVADVTTGLTGFGFVSDLALPPVETPHGRVEFVEVVCLRPEELAAWPVEVAFTGDLNVLEREAPGD